MKSRTPINEVNVAEQLVMLNNAETLKEEGRDRVSWSQGICQYESNFFGPSKSSCKGSDIRPKWEEYKVLKALQEHT